MSLFKEITQPIYTGTYKPRPVPKKEEDEEEISNEELNDNEISDEEEDTERWTKSPLQKEIKSSPLVTPAAAASAKPKLVVPKKVTASAPPKSSPAPKPQPQSSPTSKPQPAPAPVAMNETLFNSILHSLFWRDRSELGEGNIVSAQNHARSIIAKHPGFVTYFQQRMQNLYSNAAIREIVDSSAPAEERMGIISHAIARGETFYTGLINEPEFIRYLIDGEYVDFRPCLI